MTTVLPNLPMVIINQIFGNYGDLSPCGWIPVLTKEDKIKCRVNKRSKKYKNIVDVLNMKHGHPPLVHSLMINGVMMQTDATTYTLVDNVYSKILYTIYETNDNRIAYLFQIFEKLSFRIYHSKGICQYLSNYNSTEPAKTNLNEVYETNGTEWVVRANSQIMSFDAYLLPEKDNEENDIIHWHL
jgi:hypothetical protein